ncbi:MAG: hypothetical protein EP307_09270 [Rhodobacteraceae bacterium]|nr:MAG: hypothetical protein EP307_09270 [Paracoccaceae bacterium]
MQEFDKTELIAICRGKLQEDGFRVVVEQDFDRIPSILDEIGKPYLTPKMSPLYNDFTGHDCFWLLLMRDNRVVAAAGTRLDDIGGGSIAEYWRRTMRRQYGANERQVIGRVADPVEQDLRGRLAYFGDLYFTTEAGRSITTVRRFVLIGHMITSLKWNPDWTYAFLRERDVRRGACFHYGFNRFIPDAQFWIDPPAPRENTEYCAMTSRRDLAYMASSYVRSPERL